ncbi:23S rRNA pseudouridine1911/1915/1917 synthase [Micromonospora phaseoli]|uniref:Pseudouridine synthase n=1 Tax=Micromonospora phaseoli TaxID=1144548 RepID=A0A1H7D2C5_9ACTN|nr:RluA family pseudouridine synthase [Micromonospora phaseoli]PZV98131.1 ribosomal large subunit pseudouridine synthase D [Micromonospora phaseoli]GIJ77758.1 pseudouridine synthase [Micromonospora phaseoli]SEJ95921.1 23S rRNA pseudouridine1911/1915/1917 synthase [Micromonospora phaseoli]
MSTTFTAGGDQRSLPVPDGLDGMRLDQAVARLFGLSRTTAAALVDAGAARLDGTVRANSHKVRAGSWLEVTLPAPAATIVVVPQAVPGLRVVHADDDIVVVDKPVGVAAHPSPGWTGPTVIGGLAAIGHTIATSGAAERQGVVHRLDVGTTGVMVVAKSEQAYSLLKRAFKEREVEKRYHAVVQGHLDPLRGTIDAPIDRHPHHDYRWAVVSGGKPSITHYDTIEAFPSASLVDVRLETGRTHQIRVHFSTLRHPCVGDLTYGADPTLSGRLKLDRQWLHARELSFQHPRTGDEVRFVSDYPDDLGRALDILRD